MINNYERSNEKNKLELNKNIISNFQSLTNVGRKYFGFSSKRRHRFKSYHTKEVFFFFPDWKNFVFNINNT
jgi:hypothetical protein